MLLISNNKKMGTTYLKLHVLSGQHVIIIV